MRDSVQVSTSSGTNMRRRRSVPSQTITSFNPRRLRRSLLSIREPGGGAEGEQEGAVPSHIALQPLMSILASGAIVLALVGAAMLVYSKRKE